MTREAERRLIEEIVEIVPDLAPTLTEHIEDNFGELIPYVFMWDVFQAVEGAHTSPEPLSDEILRLLDHLDAAIKVATEDVRNLIAVGFLEPILDAGESLAGLRSALGPLQSELQSMENWIPPGSKKED